MINSAYSHEEYRDRVLLMTKKQINKWLKELKVKGITIVPSRAFFDKNGRFKIDICLVKGKKLYDKKDTIKDRDIKRDTDRELNSK
jgi:SsrA-binding protein